MLWYKTIWRSHHSWSSDMKRMCFANIKAFTVSQTWHSFPSCMKVWDYLRLDTIMLIQIFLLKSSVISQVRQKKGKQSRSCKLLCVLQKTWKGSLLLSIMLFKTSGNLGEVFLIESEGFHLIWKNLRPWIYDDCESQWKRAAKVNEWSQSTERKHDTLMLFSLKWLLYTCTTTCFFFFLHRSNL